jgi:hypothetical protein
MKFLIPCYFLLFAFGCKEKENRVPDSGVVSSDRYSNKFFGFSIAVPEEWDVQTKDQTKIIQDAGKEEIRSSNKELAAEIDSLEDGIQQLLTVFKYEVDTATIFNPSLVIMSEKLPQVASSFDERSYLALTRSQLSSTGLYETIDDQIITQNIGGREFFILKVTASKEQQITQEFYTSLTKGYALILIISYSGKEERNELKKIVSSLKFG